MKEVTLLGQNVNSYRDLSEEQLICSKGNTKLSRGFKTVYRTKQGGLRFADLLDRVSLIDPDMRIRFTSPHPKDFPDEVGTMKLLSSQEYNLFFCYYFRQFYLGVICCFFLAQSGPSKTVQFFPQSMGGEPRLSPSTVVQGHAPL